MDDLGAITETAGAAAIEAAVSALRARGGAVHACANCATPLVGPFCATCGQPLDTHRRSVFELLRDFVIDVASFDSRIIRTIWALLFRPGELPLAFREGRTQRYVPAVRLYLFVSLAFFVTLSLARIAIMQLVPEAHLEKIVVVDGQRYIATRDDSDPEDREKLPAWLDDGKPHYSLGIKNAVFFAREGAYHSDVPEAAIADIERKAVHDAGEKNPKRAWIKSTVRRAVEGLAKDPASLNGALTAWIPRALFVLLPAFAILLAVFYWRQRKKFYFVDHLVFSLNFHTFAFAAILAAAGLAQILSGPLVAAGITLVLSVYLFIAMKRFYGQNWFWTSTKWFTIEFFYVTSFLFPALITIFVLSVLYG